MLMRTEYVAQSIFVGITTPILWQMGFQKLHLNVVIQFSDHLTIITCDFSSLILLPHDQNVQNTLPHSFSAAGHKEVE